MLHARDLSPIDGLRRRDEVWLQRLSERISASDHLVRLGAAAEDPEPIVSRAYDGNWRTGRYVGSIAFEGHRLEIEPRLAPTELRSLLRAALNVIIPTRSGQLERAPAIVPLLLALVWCRELDSATRHGLPFLRQTVNHEGLFVRGRVQEQRTRALRRRGTLALASEATVRSLDNDIARAMVRGQATLTRLLGGDTWMTKRAKDVMPHLWAAVGSRPRLPSVRAVRAIRYTPIRMPYRALVELSWEIATGEGLRSAGAGEAEGMLIDMGELWERYVHYCAQRAALPGETVTHEATHDSASQHLYRSLRAPGVSMGRLLPDVVFRRQGNTRAVLDAKYKRAHDRPEAPNGVTREDRYQLAGYIAATDLRPQLGMLAYPAELDRNGREVAGDEWVPSSAEEHSPWSAPGERFAAFLRLSFNPEIASAQLRKTLAWADSTAVKRHD